MDQIKIINKQTIAAGQQWLANVNGNRRLVTIVSVERVLRNNRRATRIVAKNEETGRNVEFRSARKLRHRLFACEIVGSQGTKLVWRNVDTILACGYRPIVKSQNYIAYVQNLLDNYHEIPSDDRTFLSLLGVEIP